MYALIICVITSVGDSLYNIVSDRAKDVLAPHGIILTDGRYPIQVKQLRNCAPESAHSAVWAYKDHAVIEIAAKNTCWTRMAYAKELAHIYMGFVNGNLGTAPTERPFYKGFMFLAVRRALRRRLVLKR